jgi:hypothetical protein
VQKQIAVWNTDLKLWTKPNEVLFSEHLELFSATWPTSGMTQSGVAYELPMQVPHTNASEYSSLPTLSASQEPGWTVTPVDKDGNPTTNPNERWYHPETGRLMQKGVTQALMFAIPDSTLLRSPTASQGQGGALGEAEARKRGNTVGIRDQAMDLAKLQGHKVSREVANLPTPTVSDQYTGNLASTQQKPGSMHSVTLAQVFHKPELFPTPTTQDGKNNGGPSQFNRNTKPLNTEVLLIGTPRAGNYNSSSKQVELGAPKSRIEDQVLLTNWGKFEPAIRRWETILGRQAPEPTKPDGKDNNHRLSSKFTEWMMGLPDGWITGHDLKRNDELKLAGNGVVPQQAELALRLLLELPERKENDNE